ncbi:hypothetical protein Cgig2_022938 [Carnegiea gigantea]|uniref:NAC domain-containing protein n=1 Tax=Carnegiea gigantea TaxID=171969 RepID=A0A9Q1KC30_9CARY|nr:hypothetical protein Cgig2_022938 [Carnegiea gigantea]
MNGISKEAELSIAASSLFPGFRFSPTDEELILYYLKKKLDGYDKCVEVIPEVDICKYEPWDLPAKAVINSDQEWFFFSPRGKKYPNGSQSKRATEIGYWKATGKERAVKSGSNIIGTKRTLVFHIGRAPKGERTEWIMHEYCMAGKGQDALVVCRLRRKCDYHAVDGTNGEVLFSKPLSMIDSSATSSGFGLDGVGTLGGDKLPESSQKKCTSSHDSHSVEQMDSTSESDRKFRGEIIQPESSSHVRPFTSLFFWSIYCILQDLLRSHITEACSLSINMQHANEEDDLFADILNDNIVQLDECPPTAPTPRAEDIITTNSTTVSIVPRIHHQHSGEQPPHSAPWSYPSQGTANRRIRLRKLRRLSAHREELEEQSGENMVSTKAKQTRRMRLGLRQGCNKLYMVLILMALVFLFSAFGMSWCSYRPPLPRGS